MEKMEIVGSVVEPGNYSVFTEHGELVATDLNHQMALLITQLPELLELRYEWAAIINQLCHIAMDRDPSSNDLDYVEEMRLMVLPFLPGYDGPELDDCDGLGDEND